MKDRTDALIEELETEVSGINEQQAYQNQNKN